MAQNGINEQLLGALVTREELLDYIFDKQKYVDEAGQARRNKYMLHVGEVSRIKTENGISDPPPLHIPSMEQQ